MRANQFLEDAIELIGLRGQDYGHPAINHMRIAQMWSAYLDAPIGPEQVAMCMALVKIARSVESPNRADNYSDGVAYMAMSGMMAKMDWEEFNAYPKN
jgi:hypothetical protein